MTRLIEREDGHQKQIRSLTIEELQRFWSKVEKTDSCWNWVGAKFIHGYGQLKIRNSSKTLRSHKVAYELFYGNVPEGLIIDHLCRNKLCVNPNHLEAVTNHENIMRGIGPTAQNIKKTHCLNGHEFTLENTLVDKDNSRNCRTCHREYCRRWRYVRKIY